MKASPSKDPTSMYLIHKQKAIQIPPGDGTYGIRVYDKTGLCIYRCHTLTRAQLSVLNWFFTKADPSWNYITN